MSIFCGTNFNSFLSSFFTLLKIKYLILFVVQNPTKLPLPLQVIKNISALCDPRQIKQKVPKRFRVLLDFGEVVFNDLIFNNILYLDGAPVPLDVGNQTHFFATIFLSKISLTHIQITILDY